MFTASDFNAHDYVAVPLVGHSYVERGVARFVEHQHRRIEPLRLQPVGSRAAHNDLVGQDQRAATRMYYAQLHEPVVDDPFRWHAGILGPVLQGRGR